MGYQSLRFGAAAAQVSRAFSFATPNQFLWSHRHRFLPTNQNGAHGSCVCSTYCKPLDRARTSEQSLPTGLLPCAHIYATTCPNQNEQPHIQSINRGISTAGTEQNHTNSCGSGLIGTHSCHADSNSYKTAEETKLFWLANYWYIARKLGLRCIGQKIRSLILYSQKVSYYIVRVSQALNLIAHWRAGRCIMDPF